MYRYIHADGRYAYLTHIHIYVYINEYMYVYIYILYTSKAIPMWLSCSCGWFFRALPQNRRRRQGPNQSVLADFTFVAKFSPWTINVASMYSHLCRCSRLSWSIPCPFVIPFMLQQRLDVNRFIPSEAVAANSKVAARPHTWPRLDTLHPGRWEVWVTEHLIFQMVWWFFQNIWDSCLFLFCSCLFSCLQN